MAGYKQSQARDAGGRWTDGKLSAFTLRLDNPGASWLSRKLGRNKLYASMNRRRKVSY